MKVALERFTDEEFQIDRINRGGCIASPFSRTPLADRDAAPTLDRPQGKRYTGAETRPP